VKFQQPQIFGTLFFLTITSATELITNHLGDLMVLGLLHSRLVVLLSFSQAILLNCINSFYD